MGMQGVVRSAAAPLAVSMRSLLRTWLRCMMGAAWVAEAWHARFRSVFLVTHGLQGKGQGPGMRMAKVIAFRNAWLAGQGGEGPGTLMVLARWYQNLLYFTMFHEQDKEGEAPA
eukprot:1141640-Pelagomonas_calceolata.AAC.1